MFLVIYLLLSTLSNYHLFHFAVNDVSAEAFPQEVLDFLMVIRCLRLMKIVVNYKQFSVIIKTIVNILPSMLTYGAVLLVSQTLIS